MAAKQPGKKRSEKAIDKLDPRRRKYLAGRVKGKSKTDAALAAGFSESMAASAVAKIENRDYKAAFRQAVREAIPHSRIVGRLSEGLDATRDLVVITGRKGDETVDVQKLPDYRERREYLKLASLMGDYYIEKQQIEDITKRPMDEWTDDELKLYTETGKRPEA